MANPRKRKQKKLAKLKALRVKSGQSMREAVAEAQLERRIVVPKDVVEPGPEPVKACPPECAPECPPNCEPECAPECKPKASVSDAPIEPEVKKSVKASPAPKKPALKKPVRKSASKKAKKEV